MWGFKMMTLDLQYFIHVKQKLRKLPVQLKQESKNINTPARRSDRPEVKQNIQDGITDTEMKTAPTQLLFVTITHFHFLCHLIVGN